jgi:hypothetical protein
MKMQFDASLAVKDVMTGRYDRVPSTGSERDNLSEILRSNEGPPLLLIDRTVRCRP